MTSADDTPPNDPRDEDAPEGLTAEDYEAIAAWILAKTEGDTTVIPALADAAELLYWECVGLVVRLQHTSFLATQLTLVFEEMQVAALKAGDVRFRQYLEQLLRKYQVIGEDTTLDHPEPAIVLPNRAERRRIERATRREGQ